IRTLRPVGRWLLASMTLSGLLAPRPAGLGKGRCPLHARSRPRGVGEQGLKALPCSLSVRLWPLLPRQGFATSGPSPRPCRAAGRTSQPWPRCALDASYAHSAAQKRAYSAFSGLGVAWVMSDP
ncbi:hypothetical protein ACUBZR_004826, partial [Citrobacter braakii]